MRETDINKLIERYHNICDEAYKTIGTSMRIEINDHQFSLGDFYSDTKSNVREALETSGTEILVPALLESSLKKMFSLIMVPMSEVLSGRAGERAEEYTNLCRCLEEHPYNISWHKMFSSLCQEMEKGGYHQDMYGFEDLSISCDILLNALTMFSNSYYLPKQIAKGQKGKGKSVICNSISIFESIGEMCASMGKLQTERFIAVNAIAPMESQVRNWYDEYVTGIKGARIGNMMHNNQLSEEEVNNQINDWACQIIFYIKDGENIWIGTYDPESIQYGTIIQTEDFFSYGKRASYMPWQIFFSGTGNQNKDSKALTIRTKSFFLPDILDAEQTLWFHAFIYRIKELYMDNNHEDDKIYIPGENIGITVKGAEMRAANTYLPAVPVNMVFETDVMLLPETVTTNQNVLDLIRILHINASDIIDAPLGYSDLIDTSNLTPVDIWIRARKALVRPAINKLSERYYNEISEAKHTYLKACRENNEFILAELSRGGSRIRELTSIRMDKETGIEHGQYNIYTSCKFFIPDTLQGKRPPVYICIVPRTVDDIGYLMGCKREELHDILKLLMFIKDSPVKQDARCTDPLASFLLSWDEIRMKHNFEYHKYNTGFLSIGLCFSKPEFKKLNFIN